MASYCAFTQSANFPNGIDVSQLTNEIKLQYPTLLQIQIVNDDVYVIFTDDQSANFPAVGVVIDNHNPTVGTDPESNISSVVVKRVSGSGPNSGGFSNLIFDSKLYENLPNSLEHDTINTERVLIKEDGTYDITYTATCDVERCRMRVVLDDITVIPGSEQESTPGSASGENVISCRTVYGINAGSYVTVQLYSPSPGTGVLLTGLTFTIISQKAVKGDPGPTGPPGTSGSGSGDVMGPGVGSIDNAIARYDGITGTSLQNSRVLIDDNDNVSGACRIGCKTLDVHNEFPGTDGHVRFRAADDYGSDTYAHGVDVGSTNRIFATIEEGTYRQAGLLGARSSTSNSTVFGVTLSSDSGTTWDPCLILTQNCKVGICKVNPVESLDIVGNIAVTGNVDGRDISTDGSTLDTHVADATLHRVINDSGNSATELWSASKIYTELNNQTHVSANITDFNVSVDARITLQAGNANGLATLDGGGKVPASQLSLSNVLYVGSWDANTNTPTITNGTGTQGNYYVVSVSGTTNIDGFTDWQVGDWIIFNGTVWEQADHTDAVSSVAGKTGSVTLSAADIASGTFADDRIVESNVIQHESAITHQNLSGAGANTHSQIDTHISSTSNPHSVTKAQVGLTNVLDTKVKIDATAAPTATDDTISGYSIGSLWVDVTNDKAYICVDATDSTAVWIESTSQGVSSHTGLTDIGTNTHTQIDTHISNGELHRVINDSGTSVTELWSASKIDSELTTLTTDKIPYSENNLISLENGSVGGANHVKFLLTKSHDGSDDYNLGIDTDPVKLIITAEDGTHRQATIFSADVLNDSATIFGISSSSNSGSTWTPRFTIQHAGNIGIGKSGATEALDIVGNIALTGTVDGRDVAADGTTQDSHIADTTLHRVINDSGTSTTELWSADKISSELSISNNEIQQVSDETLSATTSSTFQQKLRMTTASLTNGTYKISWYCELQSSNNTARSDAQIELNDTTIIGQVREEPDHKDNIVPFSGFSFQTLSGVNTVDMDWRMNDNGTSYIKCARISLKRIS